MRRHPRKFFGHILEQLFKNGRGVVRGEGAVGGGGGSACPDRWRLVVPRQDLVVRLNGRDLDTPEEEYLPAVRPYGVPAMAWALWREVPGLSLGPAVALARRVRREGEGEVLLAGWWRAERVSLALRVRHGLLSRAEPVLECPGRDACGVE
jgi:hypothetical protein